MSRTAGRIAASARACTARASAEYEKPVPTSARSGRSASETAIGRPFSLAPPSRTATNVSSRPGSNTTPAAVPSASSTATTTDQEGKP